MSDAQLETMAAQFRKAKPLTHELGHVWLARTYWPEDAFVLKSAGTVGQAQDAAPDRASMRYGSRGPDWLDELAAVAHEGDVLVQSRRKQFADLVASGALPDLDTWLTIEHPVFTQLKQIKSRPQSGVMVMNEEEVAKLAEQAKAAGLASPMQGIDFYSMARGVIDFIDARAKRRPYDAIARHIASGGDLGQWLHDHGAAYGLPGSRAEFKREFVAWAQATHGTSTAP